MRSGKPGAHSSVLQSARVIIDVDMRTLVIGIGIPGSGKTTFLVEFAKEHGYVYLSPDDIRKKLTGDRLQQARNREVWHFAEERLKKHLSRGASVVFDATFAKGHERRSFIKAARLRGADRITAFYFDVPLAIAEARNARRVDPVAEHALGRMHALLQKDPPTLSEGLDSLVRVDEAGIVRD